MRHLKWLSLTLVIAAALLAQTMQPHSVKGHGSEHHERLCDEVFNSEGGPGLGSHCHPSDLVRIEARQLEDGRVELALRLWDGEQLNWGTRLLPSARRLPTTAQVGRWLTTSSLRAHAQGDDHVIHRGVRIQARRLADGRVEVGLQVGYDAIEWDWIDGEWIRGDSNYVWASGNYVWSSGMGGEARALPQVRFVPNEYQGSHWQHSSPLDLDRWCGETGPHCWPLVTAGNPPSTALSGQVYILMPGIYHPGYRDDTDGYVPPSPELPPHGNYIVSPDDAASCLVSTAYSGPEHSDVVASLVDTVFVTSTAGWPQASSLAELREVGLHAIGHRFGNQTLTIFSDDFVIVGSNYGNCTLTWLAPQP